ncbi:hypothetical protein [Criblamydia sequanensis]|uniref:Phosphoprotein phosphatase n=1 Tax=Candidatus Criblamydia sequanensis CRIB-18 TaxID=1437425 RepID=A0A090CYL6_9BACT|nr:hypothetical protein [Criblamydia sequanensis]CDR33561.1 Phosphoprotein phosphatase [Criblamydia sequanensis CRIB-18]
MITPSNKAQDTYSIMNAEDQKVKARQAKTKAAKLPVFKPSILPRAHENKVVKEAPQATIQAKDLPKTQANESLKQTHQDFADNQVPPIASQSLKRRSIGPMPQDDLIRFLQGAKPGTFLLKESSRKEGVVVACIVGKDSKISFVYITSKQEAISLIKSVGLEPQFIDPVQFYAKTIERNSLVQSLKLTPEKIQTLVKKARIAHKEGKTLEIALSNPFIIVEARFENGHLVLKEMDSLKISCAPYKIYLNQIHHGQSSREASLQILKDKVPGSYILRTRANGDPVVDLLTDNGDVYSVYDDNNSLLEIFTRVSEHCTNMGTTPIAIIPTHRNVRQIRSLSPKKAVEKQYFLDSPVKKPKQKELKAVKETQSRQKVMKGEKEVARTKKPREKEVVRAKKSGEKEVARAKQTPKKKVEGTLLPGNKLIEQLVTEKRALKDIAPRYRHLVNTYRALRNAKMLDLLQHIDLTHINTSAKPLNWSTSEFSAQGPRPSMEDAHLHLKLPEMGELYCVFDGHGGDFGPSHPVADLAKEVFEREFENELKENPKDAAQVFNKLFAKIHKEAVEKKLPGGTTAVVTFVDTNNIATIGTIADSEARVARKIDGKWRLIPLSLVMDFGKRKEAKRAPMETQRAWAENPAWFGNAKNRRVALQNVSRALGDNFEGIAHKAKISQFQLEKDDLLIVGCDGIWDYVMDEEILKLIDSKGNLDANALGEFALYKKYAQDNVTVMVSKAN